MKKLNLAIFCGSFIVVLFGGALAITAKPGNCKTNLTCLLNRVKKCAPATAMIVGKPQEDAMKLISQIFTTTYAVKKNDTNCELSISSKRTAVKLTENWIAGRKMKMSSEEIAGLEKQLLSVAFAKDQVCTGNPADLQQAINLISTSETPVIDIPLSKLSCQIISSTSTAYADAGTVTRNDARLLGAPAMTVNGVAVSYQDYDDDLSAIMTMWSYDKSHNGPSASLTVDQLSDQVLFRQANNILIEELARKYAITIAQEDLTNVETNILDKQYGSRAASEKILKERYGWSLAEFEDKVVRPYVLQNKLTGKINNDQASQELIKAQAQSVLDQLKGGADFTTLAKQYSQDGSAANGGELGWFGKGAMVPAFETAAFSLKKGELMPTLVKSPFGYHIIQVEDVRTDSSTDANGQTVSKEMVKARHILFTFPTLEKVLSDEIKNANIHIYLKIHNPFSAAQNDTNFINN